MDFPGRMRDHVAEACKVSKSKLARLKVIREKLQPGWQKLYEADKINESTAYAMAQLPPAHQKIMFDNSVGQMRKLSEGYVRNCAQALGELAALRCTHNAGQSVPCEHASAKAARITMTDAYSVPLCGKCCDGCPSLATCRDACPNLAKQIRAAKDQRKFQQQQNRKAKEDRERPHVEVISRVWQRFGEARAAAGLSVEEYEAIVDLYYSKDDDEKYPKMEHGKGITVSTPLPYGYGMGYGAVERLVKAADALGCSLDYLFGRTDDPYGRIDCQALTQNQIDKMHFDKVWLSYGDEDPDDGEWAIVNDGCIFSLLSLEGAGFTDIFMDEFSHLADKLERPSGSYTVHYGPPHRQAADQRG